MNHSIIALGSSLALVIGSHAAVLIENFDSYSSDFDDMDGKGSWVVTNNSANVPVILDESAATWDSSAHAATVGGEAPGAGTVTSLYSLCTVPLVTDTAHPTSFEFEFAYTESIDGDPRNDFRIILHSGAFNLLEIGFVPAGAGSYMLNWDSDWIGGGTANLGTKAEGVSTSIRMETWADGLDVKYKLSNAGIQFAAGTLSGVNVASNASVDKFSVEWDTLNGVGSNSITVDNITLVPEPAAALLGLMGTSFFFLRRRRL